MTMIDSIAHRNAVAVFPVHWCDYADSEFLSEQVLWLLHEIVC
jgi:hypothetical protein